MSDEEDYYSDDFDGDWLWYDDINLGVADDLAEAATFSPVAVDDPSFETLESFSDWEYYSDDFYDDDPPILRRRRAANPLQEAENQLDGPPRKRKRKASTADDIPFLSLPTAVVDLPTDVDSFRGVIWRKPDSAEQEPDLYEPGHGEKVALLKDWREVFRTSNYKNDRLRESHPHNRAGLNGHVSERHLNLPEHTVRELTPPGQDDTIMGEGYGLVLESDDSYSPPPETVGEMGRPHHEHKTRKAPHLRTTSLLREVMAVDDEVSNITTILQSSQKEDSVVREGTSTEQQEAGIQKLLRVEIPAAPDVSPPPLIPSRRRRGRKPRASMVAEENDSTPASPVSPQNRRRRPGRKPRASMAAEEQRSSPRSRRPRNNAMTTATVEEDESRRSSTRVTSLQQQSRATSNDRKRRRRASSPAAPSTLRRSKRAKAA